MNPADRLDAMQARLSETRWGRPGSTGAAHVRYAAQKEVAEYLPATIAALRAVLDLHHPVLDILPWLPRHPAYCGECSDDEVVTYPCPTVRAITEALT